MKKDTVTINGVAYDAHTGMRVLGEQPAQKSVAPKTTIAAQSVHAKSQRTKTLAKRHTKAGKRTTLLQAPPEVTKKSPHISKFATHHPTKKQVISDIGPQTHVAQTKHRQTVAAAHQKTSVPPAHVVKSKAITDAVAKSTKKSHPKKKSFFARHSRLFNISSIIIVLLLVAGYITYVNLPSLSVKIAASRAGIAADYPSYQPAGYRFDGPVEVASGEIKLHFVANAGPQKFTITQTKSNWDSSALLENYVRPTYNNDYATYTNGGLTIYVHGTDAAWVNSGVLHTITGEASLTSDQIRRIALSM